MTAMQKFFADAFAARASLIKSTRQATGRNARRLALKHGTKRGARPARDDAHCLQPGDSIGESFSG